MNGRAFLLDLRRVIDRRADRLDSQWLADPYVTGMDSDEVGAHFEQLTSDWDLAVAHVRADGDGETECPVDGEAQPCRIVRSLALSYDVRPEAEA